MFNLAYWASRRARTDLSAWHDLLHKLRNPECEITIAVVGKYSEHRDAYKSIYEVLDDAVVANRPQVRIERLHSEAVEREGPDRLLSAVDGILSPGGFGERGIEGKVDDAVAKGDTTQARKCFTTVQQCGEALDSTNCPRLAQFVGQAFKKSAQSELAKIGR